MSRPATSEVVIEPGRGGLAGLAGELWAYRELVYFLTLRDLRVRYRQTAVGVAWIVLQPLLTMLLFTVAFGRLVRVPTGGIPYPLFVFAGLVPWQFFSSSVTGSSSALLLNQNLISKVYFPRLAVPLASVASKLVDFALLLLMAVGVLIWQGRELSWQWCWLPVLTMATVGAGLAAGTWFSALYVRYRDVGLVLPFLLQAWMFLSPVVYPTTRIPEGWRVLYGLNPLCGLVESWRSMILGEPLPLALLGLACLVIAFFLGSGVMYFRSVEDSFADVI